MKNIFNIYLLLGTMTLAACAVDSKVGGGIGSDPASTSQGNPEISFSLTGIDEAIATKSQKQASASFCIESIELYMGNSKTMDFSELNHNTDLVTFIGSNLPLLDLNTTLDKTGLFDKVRLNISDSCQITAFALRNKFGRIETESDGYIDLAVSNIDSNKSAVKLSFANEANILANRITNRADLDNFLHKARPAPDMETSSTDTDLDSFVINN